MKSLILCATLSCLFISQAFSQLNVLMPPKLQEWWDNNPEDTHTSIAAFGDIPWGRRVMGKLALADPIDGCDYFRVKDDDLEYNPIYVANRGNCPFYLKAHYAQLAGAKMLIIVDNQYEEVESQLMIDVSGQGDSIHIPSILLAKPAGDKIIDSLKFKNEKISNIQVTYSFELPKDNKVEYHVWLSSSSTQTLKFIKEWKTYADKLDNVATMVPHFAHFKMLSTPIEGDPQNDNCICGGKYCGTDPDGDLPGTGADVVLEDLRQLCLIKEYGIDIWWQYITNYDENCLTKGGDVYTCFQNTLYNKVHSKPEGITECVQDSFDVNDMKTCKSNKILDNEADSMVSDGVVLFPSVFINGFMYRGNLMPASGLFGAICETFNDIPGVCEDHFEVVLPGETRRPKHKFAVVAALFFLVLFGLFVFCCYRRYLKREMYKQMVRDVNIAVSQYIAFKDADPDKAELEGEQL